MTLSQAIREYEEEKVKLSLRELTNKYIAESSLQARIEKDWAGGLKRAVIALDGPLAALPSIKNSKQMTKNGIFIISTDYRARLAAMDFMFFNEVGRELTFGKEPLWLVVLCGKRKGRYDPDNCMSSVKDWLEPNEKGVKNKTKSRGWGVGLCPDDSLISGICLKGEQVGLPGTKTYILLEHWALAAVQVNQFVETFVQQIKNSITLDPVFLTRLRE